MGKPQTVFVPTTQRPVPTLKDARDSIPPECFDRSAIKGLSLVARDLAIVGFLACVSAFFLPFEGLTMLGICGWTLYVVLQGTAMTGLWVLAHECGHGAFSDYAVLNNFVGFFIHTALLVPYFSWQYSHAKHHSKTNHLLDGETHVPPKGVRGLTKTLVSVLSEDAFAVWQLVSHLLLGWPLYLLFNATGARRRFDRKRYKGVPNHFNPYSELFPESWRIRVLISSVGIGCWIAFLVQCGSWFGTRKVVLLYALPYLVTNGWLVLYTWLQHVNEYVPQYGEDEWTWMKGALSTIDRPYWGPVDWMHHHIGTTHVAHHVFSTIPCYNAPTATTHLKNFLGNLYQYDERPIIQALWQVSKTCHYVDEVSGVQRMKSAYSQKKTD